MPAPSRSGSAGEGAAYHCCTPDHSVRPRATGSTALYGASRVSSTCSKHINTHWPQFGSFTAVALAQALTDLLLRLGSFCPITDAGDLCSHSHRGLSQIGRPLTSNRHANVQIAAGLVLRRPQKHCGDAGSSEEPWNVEDFTLQDEAQHRVKAGVWLPTSPSPHRRSTVCRPTRHSPAPTVVQVAETRLEKTSLLAWAKTD